MESPKKQVTARIPELIYLGAAKKAELKGVTFTDILIEALEQYLGDDLPGLCPGCHTQNAPESQFCQNCGEPINSDASISLQQQIDEIKEKLDIIIIDSGKRYDWVENRKYDEEHKIE